MGRCSYLLYVSQRVGGMARNRVLNDPWKPRTQFHLVVVIISYGGILKGGQVVISVTGVLPCPCFFLWRQHVLRIVRPTRLEKLNDASTVLFLEILL